MLCSKCTDLSLRPILIQISPTELKNTLIYSLYPKGHTPSGRWWSSAVTLILLIALVHFWKKHLLDRPCSHSQKGWFFNATGGHTLSFQSPFPNRRYAWFSPLPTERLQFPIASKLHFGFHVDYLVRRNFCNFLMAFYQCNWGRVAQVYLQRYFFVTVYVYSLELDICRLFL